MSVFEKYPPTLTQSLRSSIIYCKGYEGLLKGIICLMDIIADFIVCKHRKID